ncbi:hypothetical protein [Nocardia sp. NPDC003345]
MPTTGSQAVPPADDNSADEPTEAPVSRGPDPGAADNVEPVFPAQPSPCAEGAIDTAAPPPGPVAQAVELLNEAAAEQELYELLRAHEVRGEVWETVVATITAYAGQVLDPWIWTGEIYRRLAKKRIRLQAGPAERASLTADREYRQEVIGRTIIGALTKFQAKMREGKGWNPCRGAKLTTYFLTACLYEFPQAFGEDLRWRRTNQLIGSEYDDVVKLLDTRQSSTIRAGDPLDAVTDRLMIQAFLATLTDIDKIIVLAASHGYTHREIAHLFPELTVRAVEGRIGQIRKSAHRNLRSII